MEKSYFGAIEFGSIYTTILVASLNHNKLDVVALDKFLSNEFLKDNTSEFATNGFYDGKITDSEAFNSNLAALLEKISRKYKINLDEIILVLPNNDHKIYQASVTNKVLTERQIIGTSQINSIKNQIKKAKLNEGEVLVEDVPAFYILDNNSMYRSAPIGHQSSTLSIKIGVHTLPSDIYLPIVDGLKNQGLNVIDHFLNCSCGAFVNDNHYQLETESLVISVNQESTTIASFDKNLLTKSIKVDFGMIHLVNYLAKSLNIKKTLALELMETYFVCDINSASDIIIEPTLQLSQKRICGIILNQLYEGFEKINDAINGLITELDLENKPKYFVVGVLNDYEDFSTELAKKLNENVQEITIDLIGADSQIYVNCLGAIKLFIERNPSDIEQRFNDNGEISTNINVNKLDDVKNNDDTNSRFKDIFDD